MNWQIYLKIGQANHLRRKQVPDLTKRSSRFFLATLVMPALSFNTCSKAPNEFKMTGYVSFTTLAARNSDT